ncbi:MAG: sulfate ABC transporter permease subunit CysW [Microbacterium sp.]|uniref:sulfate ABC transporter permease subunit CysW n=1 Tax=Microbacterium sp. TaxID=51671 RepID=UPI001DB5900D|nr:sulfate ABC transporter permease subunit CysW [Microbacterium sp.]MBW8760975.1 sulfate ABC transporter permease subunit CysW [Microbacterium sp.]
MATTVVPGARQHGLPPGPRARAQTSAPTNESALARRVLIGVALAYLFVFLGLPLYVVFQEALKKGLTAYLTALREPELLHALRLTLLVAGIAVPLNVVFGIAAAWAITKGRVRGRTLLIALADLPLAVSPVIAGLTFMLLFGMQGWFGPWLRAHDIKIAFTVTAVVLATIFVTLPFVARELIPLMEEQGVTEEEAAVTLGASGWQIFRRVTAPNIRWGLLYGIVLCNARAMGEFGAVSVVSGRIRGQTTTLPLHIEILYNEYDFTAAFAASSLLALLAVVTLAAKHLLERSHHAARARIIQEQEERGA